MPHIVRSTSSTPWMKCFPPCHMLDWLHTVLVMINVDGKLKYTTAICLPSPDQNNLKFTSTWVIKSYLLSLVFFVTLIQQQCDRVNFGSRQSLIVWMNVQNYHQQWYQCPQQLERHVYDLFKFSTDSLYYLWQTRLKKNWQFPTAFWSILKWQTK